MDRPIHRALPIALGLSWVGGLFGALAAERSWNAADVAACSAGGFTGSGQFAYLQMLVDGTPPFVAFAVVLAMNLRYLPMAVSAPLDRASSPVARAVVAHFLSDESYAVEREGEGFVQRSVVRLLIAGAWVASTIAGQVLAARWGLSPSAWLPSVGFPASALLLLLAVGRMRELRSASVELCGRLPWIIAIAGALVILLGRKHFWIPSIALGTAMLCAGARKERTDEEQA